MKLLNEISCLKDLDHNLEKETLQKSLNSYQNRVACVGKKKPFESCTINKLPKISFDASLHKDAHEDLIVSIDVCIDSNMIVTGSRDTSIRVWNIKGVKLQCLTGHLKSLTKVKFWAYKSYLTALKINEKDVDLPDFKRLVESDTEAKKCPLILSTSLDCSLRLWSVNKGDY